MNLATALHDYADSRLAEFVRESNRIEGILRDPTADEIQAHVRLLRLLQVQATTLGDFQAVVAPGKPLRERRGMNVRVGNHVAPEGGPGVVRKLQAICRRANRHDNPWTVHVAFEILHPYMDGNGRTGRALWAWNMQALGLDPFALPFLHRFYYQTLSAQRKPHMVGKYLADYAPLTSEELATPLDAETTALLANSKPVRR